jgi:hypothetical protein
MAFVDRTLHAASCRTILEVNDRAQNSNQQHAGVMLTMADFETARKGFVPVALKGISMFFTLYIKVASLDMSLRQSTHVFS